MVLPVGFVEIVFGRVSNELEDSKKNKQQRASNWKG